MFEWLHHHQDSPELAHARARQHVRDIKQKQKDPLAEYEVIDTGGLVVQELSGEEVRQPDLDPE